jgi:hypothetical protein
METGQRLTRNEKVNGRKENRKKKHTEIEVSGHYVRLNVAAYLLEFHE